MTARLATPRVTLPTPTDSRIIALNLFAFSPQTTHKSNSREQRFEDICQKTYWPVAAMLDKNNLESFKLRVQDANLIRGGNDNDAAF